MLGITTIINVCLCKNNNNNNNIQCHWSDWLGNCANRSVVDLKFEVFSCRGADIANMQFLACGEFYNDSNNNSNNEVNSEFVHLNGQGRNNNSGSMKKQMPFFGS